MWKVDQSVFSRERPGSGKRQILHGKGSPNAALGERKVEQRKQKNGRILGIRELRGAWQGLKCHQKNMGVLWE